MMGRILLAAILGGSLLVAAPPGPVLPQEREKCPAEPPPPRGRPGPGRVYRDCEVDRAARLRSEGRLEFTPAAPGQGRDWRCEEAELTFVVDTAGQHEPGTIRIVATTNLEFAAAVVGHLSTVRYRPALLAGKPVRQAVVYRKTLLTRKRTDLRSSQVTPEGRPQLRC